MKFTEELLWILDKEGIQRKGDAEYKQNIHFVHSLGLKCDCVGWSRLELSDPRANEILAAIEQFCKENGWKARGYYDRTFPETESDWFELVPSDIKDETDGGRIQVAGTKGATLELSVIRAFHELYPAPKYACWRDEILVPERFRNVCLQYLPDDADFCWAQDKGKYAAEQYFHLYCSKRIARIGNDRGIRREDQARMAALGGYLPKIAEIFYELQSIKLQDCYLAEDLPAGGMAYVYYARPEYNRYEHTILIHKDFAGILLREKALSPSMLRPAMVASSFPDGYTVEDAHEKERPTPQTIAQMLAQYEELKATPRPVRMISEKDALKVLRKAKRERKEDYEKAMRKARHANLSGTPYAPLIPYYLVADGGLLSDEYSFLSYDHAISNTEVFMAQLAAEELLEEKPDGVVFAKCPDGDSILLYTNGIVIRFSHEEPVVTAQWPSLAQFFFDAINECE